MFGVFWPGFVFVEPFGFQCVGLTESSVQSGCDLTFRLPFSLGMLQSNLYSIEHCTAYLALWFCRCSEGEAKVRGHASLLSHAEAKRFPTLLPAASVRL